MVGTLLPSKQEEPHHPSRCGGIRGGRGWSFRLVKKFRSRCPSVLSSSAHSVVSFERGAHRQDSKSTVLSGQEGSCCTLNESVSPSFSSNGDLSLMGAESRCDETSSVKEGGKSSIPPIQQIWEGLQLPFSATSASISNSSDRADENSEGNSLRPPRRMESAPKTDAIWSDKTPLSTKEIVSNASIDPYSSTHDEVAKQLEQTCQAPGGRTSSDSNKENPKDEVEEASSSLVKQIPGPSGSRTSFVQNEATCSEQLTKNDSRSVSCRSIVVTPKKSALKKSDMSPKKALPPRSVSAEFEVRLPCRRDLLRRQRSLSFREYAEVAQIEPAASLAERPDDLWFQEKELETIKRRNSKLINKIKTQQQAGESTVSKRYCARGLERLINPNPTIMKRIQGRDAVLNEQDVQRSEGVFEEDIIACAYMVSSFRSQREAAIRASEDEQEAKKYFKLEDEEEL